MKSTIYIQRATFCELGFLIETAEQRELVKQIAVGASTQSDSPETQWALYNILRPYLSKNATLINVSEMPMHHSMQEHFKTRSDGVVILDQSLGWVTIECDQKGAEYLERLLREMRFSVDTTQEAIGG